MSANHRLYMVRDGTQKEIRVYDTPVAEIPHVASQTATQITSNKALIKTDIAANLDVATFHVEYGARPCSEVPNPCASTAESSGIGASFLPRPETGVLTDLKPDTQYYYRVVASNGVGSEQGPDRSFHTFPEPVFDPTCTNNLARQQTRAAFLLDCRAYELVSAENQGGYDVESDLIPGQTPYAGFPQADGKALYGVHNGGIPNTGKPTNRGIDPYVATRDAEHQRWNTSYVGVPADAPSTSPFSSTVAGADSSLNSFAFDGSDICDPCFAGGSNGIPIRTPDGSLTQGMAGSIDVPFPESAGGVRKHFSADGSHFLFSSKQQFEPGGNSSGTDATVYDRNLDTNQTQVVSTDETGATIAAGTDVRALDVSEHGDRVLIGVLNHTDAAGNEYYDLYLHKGTNPNSTPIETGGTGALYAGMTKDGSQIHFTTRDNLADETSDTSADLFRATISGGVVTIERVSKNVAGIDNDDSCDPSANSYNSEDWNVVPGEPTDCSVVAIGGQGGVASDSGAIYFLSPEQLDGNGVAGSPNIFLAKPGEDPQFVSTLESSANEPLGAPEPTFTRSTGPFTTPASAAIDRADGSYYVYDLGNSTFFLGPKDASISKFDASGNLVAGFGSGGSVGGLGGDNGNGFIPLPPMPTSIAVDNNPAHVAPGFVDTYRDVFVLDSSTGFSAKSSIKRYDSSGNLEQTITPAFATGIFSGIAVDPISGNLYVSVYDQSLLPGGQVWVYQPDGLGGFAPGAPIALISVDAQPRGIAVDSNNKVYVVTSSGDVKVYNGGSSALLGTLPGSSPASAVAVDVGSYADTNDDLIYVDQGNKVVEYDSSGAATGRTFGGAGVVGGSIGLGADSSNLVVSNRNGGNVAVFEAKTESKPGYDHPLVINSVREAGTRHTADFQVTPSGDHAVFPSVQSQTGFDNGGRYELFRYDSAVDKLDCVSCNTTNQIPTTDASLSGNGLSIADDGRVFFNTGEPLVLRDTNGKLDAYEWKENPDGQGGKAELISSGQDRSDSGLLTVSADGKDAYFFTREVLATQDHNGTLMKLYDAREQGGFFIIPPQPSCKASDECHGPGTQAAPPAPLGTLKGTLGNVPEPPVCDVKSLSKSAKRFAKRAKAMRRRAAHAKGKRAKALRKKAHKFAKKVRGRSKATKRCRARIRRSK
ncbi:MAG TPA: hypothetical protein VF176_04995 [Solirubrobacterales bacterium]